MVNMAIDPSEDPQFNQPRKTSCISCIRQNFCDNYQEQRRRSVSNQDTLFTEWLLQLFVNYKINLHIIIMIIIAP